MRLVCKSDLVCDDSTAHIVRNNFAVRCENASPRLKLFAVVVKYLRAFGIGIEEIVDDIRTAESALLGVYEPVCGIIRRLVCPFGRPYELLLALEVDIYNEGLVVIELTVLEVDASYLDIPVAVSFVGGKVQNVGALGVKREGNDMRSLICGIVGIIRIFGHFEVCIAAVELRVIIRTSFVIALLRFKIYEIVSGMGKVAVSLVITAGLKLYEEV